MLLSALDSNPSTNESVSLDSVPEGTTAENVDNYLVFKDKDGNVLNLEFTMIICNQK